MKNPIDTLPTTHVIYGTMPVLFHIPHDSTNVPFPLSSYVNFSVADGIDVDRESRIIADFGVSCVFERWHERFVNEQTERLRSAVADKCENKADRYRLDRTCYSSAALANTPYTIRFDVSRLFVDVEKLDDGTEELLASGMGPFYTKTAYGDNLYATTTDGTERILPLGDETLRKSMYKGYADTMESLTRHIIDRYGFCLIVDLHSYSRDKLPYELHSDEERPCVCVGHNGDARSRRIADCIMRNVGDYLDDRWSLRSTDGIGDELPFAKVNEPFSGSYVPLGLLGDERVASIMLEVRKDMYSPAYVDGFNCYNASIVDKRVIDAVDACVKCGVREFGVDVTRNGGVGDDAVDDIVTLNR